VGVVEVEKSPRLSRPVTIVLRREELELELELGLELE